MIDAKKKSGKSLGKPKMGKLFPLETKGARGKLTGGKKGK
jgi:hypothetical protein